MVNTIKFSQMMSGGDLSNNNITAGIADGTNVIFNNPWTFLASGTSSERPPITSDIYYRLRFNTTLQVYEYYDPVSMTWAQLSGSGTGTVNPGSTNDIAFYASNGQSVSPLATAANSVLKTSNLGVPSLSTTLPTGITIPNAIITNSTATLTAGSITAAPVAGNDLVNKTYVDGIFGSGVESITGTTNQVIASSPTGNVTLSLPQDIGTSSEPEFLNLKLSSGFMLDPLNVPMARFLSNSSAVNYLEIINSSSGTTPAINSVGGDSNIGMVLATRGNAGVQFVTSAVSNFPFQIYSGTGSQHLSNFSFSNTANTINVTFQDTSGTVAYLADITANGTVNNGTINQVAWYAATGNDVSGFTISNNSALIADGSGNLSSLGYSTTSTANNLVERDSNANIFCNNDVTNQAVITAGGTTILTAASAKTQIVSGSGATTIQLPNAATLKTGWTFYINNNTASNVSIVKNDGVTSVVSMPAGQYLQLYNTDILSTNGLWDYHWLVPTNMANGQVMIGNTTGGPKAANITAASGITVTNAANSITIGRSIIPQLSANLTNTASITNGTAAKVVCNVVVFDTTSAFSSGTYTPLVAGNYQVTASAGITFGGNDSSSIYRVMIYKNGSEYARTTIVNTVLSASLTLNVSALVAMNGTTDTLELWVFNGSPSPRNLVNNAQNTYLCATLIN